MVTHRSPSHTDRRANDERQIRDALFPQDEIGRLRHSIHGLLPAELAEMSKAIEQNPKAEGHRDHLTESAMMFSHIARAMAELAGKPKAELMEKVLGAGFSGEEAEAFYAALGDGRMAWANAARRVSEGGTSAQAAMHLHDIGKGPAALVATDESHPDHAKALKFFTRRRLDPYGWRIRRTHDKTGLELMRRHAQALGETMGEWADTAKLIIAYHGYGSSPVLARRMAKRAGRGNISSENLAMIEMARAADGFAAMMRRRATGRNDAGTGKYLPSMTLREMLDELKQSTNGRYAPLSPAVAWTLMYLVRLTKTGQ